MVLEFCFDPCGVADQKKFIDVTVFTQRHNGAGNEVRRAKVTAHRIEGDLHQCETLRTLAAECKAKMRNDANRDSKSRSGTDVAIHDVTPQRESISPPAST